MIVVTMPNGAELVAEGVLEGEITRVPSGAGGFGYDPVMHVAELGATVAELSLDAKNAISHRGRAARNMVRLLKEHGGSQVD